MKNRKVFAFVLAVVMVFGTFSIAFAETELETTSTNEISFTDVSNHWGADAIVKWSGHGIINGYEGLFRPNDSITRGEMAVILDNMMDYQVAANNTFTDLKAGQFYTDAILKANEAGIIKGDGATVRPTDKITREEASVMLARAFAISESIGNGTFKDKEIIASWAIGFVTTMQSKGYVQGTDNNFLPKTNVTRAETVTMIDNIVKGYYTTAGTYTENVAGTGVVKVSGVILKDITISENLIIAEGVGLGQGEVTLDNVTVLGSKVVRGGADMIPEVLGIEDYYPMNNNARYVYEGKGNEYASYEVFVEYASGNKIQQRVENGGTVMARVLELKDGKLTRLLSKGETYYRENLLDKKDGADEVILMEPLQKGTTWTLADGRERSITSTSTQITTSLGTYDAIEVVTEGPNDKVTDYYAKNIGLVKSIFTSEGMEVISSLKQMEVNATRVELLQFYFPNVDHGKIYLKNKQIFFKTNDITSEILEKAYKDAIVSNLNLVFGVNTKINRLKLNDDGKVEIDLNAAFVTEMNAGAAYESMILQCIANTFGNYYNVEEVILTIDNNVYSSGHIKLKEGESIHVKYEGVIELDV